MADISTTMMPVSEAEAEVLALLRGEALRQFTLTVTRLDGAWAAKLASVDESMMSEGVGLSFEEAWNSEAVALRGQFGVIQGGRTDD